MPEPEAHRQVARRDGGLEGGPDAEAGPRRKAKDAQRDLTSLSGPVDDE